MTDAGAKATRYVEGPAIIEAIESAQARHCKRLTLANSRGMVVEILADDLLQALARLSEGSAPPTFQCKAKNASPEPQDCDYPFCGCDPAAERVLSALQEGGYFIAREGAERSAPPMDHVRRLSNMVENDVRRVTKCDAPPMDTDILTRAVEDGLAAHARAFDDGDRRFAPRIAPYIVEAVMRSFAAPVSPKPPVNREELARWLRSRWAIGRKQPYQIEDWWLVDADALLEYMRSSFAVPVAEEWRDIASAPKDGSSFLAICGSLMTVGHWQRHAGAWCCVSPSYELYPADEQITHWMPLPRPPSDASRTPEET